jgi:hypothetical protein
MFVSKIFSFIAFILLLAFGPRVGAQDIWGTLSRDGCTIHFPTDWKANTSGEMETSFFLLAPPVPATDSQAYRPTISLVRRDMQGQHISLEDWTQVSVETLQKTYTDFNLLSTQKLTDEVGPYYRVIYTIGQKHITLKFIQLYRVRETHMYILSFVCDDKDYLNYRTVAEKIMATFKFD